MPAVTSVVTWVPNPGKAAEFLANAATAKGIHERLGADVMLAQTQTGGVPMSLVYMLSFESGSAYGAFIDAVNADEEWLQFWASVATDPSGQMVGSALYSAIDL